MTDQALATACAEGDTDAIRLLVRRHSGRVRRVLWRFGIDEDELDDLVQEVLIALIPALGRFRGDSQLTTFIYRITARVALQHRRSAGRRRARERAWADARAASSPGAISSPDRALLAHERRARVLALLDQISPKRRIALILREVEGLDTAEVAQVLGIPRVTVRTRLYHARRDLIRLIQADPELSWREPT